PISSGEKADDGSGDTDWCTLQPAHGTETPSAYGEGGVTTRLRRGITAFRTGRLPGLSGMQGNLHVPFLGGWAGAIPPGYPAHEETCRKATRPDPTHWNDDPDRPCLICQPTPAKLLGMSAGVDPMQVPFDDMQKGTEVNLSY